MPAPAKMGGLESLSLSSGPAVSDAGGSGLGNTGTGDFNFKAQGGGLQGYLPVVALVVVAWLILKK